MKFLCEHCKAKYQIADEKVAGRTVRMKCRKCGNSIEVSADVTETSVGFGAVEPAPRAAPPRATPLATSLSQPARSPISVQQKPDDGALAGAFQRNVHRDDEGPVSGLDLRELSAADEWYVAVNGVPVGPVRVGEIRRKAAMGAVTEDSLCWQEGMEEWRAIRTVTELAALVREAVSGGRTSHLPAEPRVSQAPPVRPAPPRAPPPRAAPARPPTSAPVALAKGRPVAPSPRFHSNTPSEDDGAPTIVGGLPSMEDIAAPSTQPRNGAPAASNGSGPSPIADPFRQLGTGASRPAAPSPFAAAAATAAVESFTAPLPLISMPAVAPVAVSEVAAPATERPPVSVAPVAPRSSSTNPIAIGMIVMFGCFGIAGAYFAFFRPDRTIIERVQVPAAAAPTPTDIPAPESVTSPGASAAAAAAANPATRANPSAPRTTGGTAGASAKPAPVAVTDPALRDLIGASGNGPTAGPTGGGGGGTGGQMTEDDVRSVVNQHNLGVRRTCWDKSSTTTASVNVTVHIVVAGSGQVTSTSATGNDPVVGHCLEEEIKRWRWPGGGEVNVPFHFLRQ